VRREVSGVETPRKEESSSVKRPRKKEVLVAILCSKLRYCAGRYAWLVALALTSAMICVFLASYLELDVDILLVGLGTRVAALVPWWDDVCAVTPSPLSSRLQDETKKKEVIFPIKCIDEYSIAAKIRLSLSDQPLSLFPLLSPSPSLSLPFSLPPVIQSFLLSFHPSTTTTTIRRKTIVIIWHSNVSLQYCNINDLALHGQI